MHIVLVLNSYDFGGAETQAALCARLIKQHTAHQVSVVALRDTGKIYHQLDGAGIPCQVTPFQWPRKLIYLPARLLRFTRELRAIRPDVLMSYTVVPNVACALSWRMVGAIAMVWNQTNTGYTRYLERWQRVAVRIVPCLVSNTAAGAAYLTDILGAPPDRVRVVHNAVAVSPSWRDRQYWRAQLQLGAQDFVGCMVANLRWPKDHATLISAWKYVVDSLRQSRQKATLLLVGGPESQAIALKAQAYDLGLVGNVRFLGHVMSGAEVMRAADVALLISRSEGISNSLIEAMSMGLPVVATDIPGNREAVGVALSEMLVPVGDVNALAGKLLCLARSPDLRRTIGEAAALRATTAFGTSRFLSETLDAIHWASQPTRRRPLTATIT